MNIDPPYCLSPSGKLQRQPWSEVVIILLTIERGRVQYGGRNAEEGETAELRHTSRDITLQLSRGVVFGASSREQEFCRLELAVGAVSTQASHDSLACYHDGRPSSRAVRSPSKQTYR
ncbi:hypothetical protein ElyMa_003930800 [Elysia marginata]|uniref:Pirin N-terminal domain-containing protein n=1 Tax=Elysia marginata TaxID=1093978 RepID=A0AAV4FQQ2_9GAST|nr:hypothetical protein ElyMa_003930800 [Elysia marginata]